MDTLRAHGLSGTSARSIAATAGVNQALIFYHFGTLDELLAAACTYGTEQHVAHYRDRFAGVATMADLLALSRTIRDEQHGDLVVLGHMLAGAQTEPALARATAAGLGLWAAEIEDVLTRVLGSTPLAGSLDVPGLARAVAAAFIGLELYAGVDAEGTGRAFDALDQLGALFGLLEKMGPLTQRAVRHQLRRPRGEARA
ncbi:TetR/AcrR family transcriptional regulator [Yinghuangia aomiensis]